MKLDRSRDIFVDCRTRGGRTATAAIRLGGTRVRWSNLVHSTNASSIAPDVHLAWLRTPRSEVCPVASRENGGACLRLALDPLDRSVMPGETAPSVARDTVGEASL